MLLNENKQIGTRKTKRTFKKAKSVILINYLHVHVEGN